MAVASTAARCHSSMDVARVRSALTGSEGPPALHRLRVAAGVTVTVAAEAVGVSVGTLRRWERGLTLSGPNDAAAQILADLFGVSLSTVKAATQESRARSR